MGTASRRRPSGISEAGRFMRFVILLLGFCLAGLSWASCVQFVWIDEDGNEVELPVGPTFYERFSRGMDRKAVAQALSEGSPKRTREISFEEACAEFLDLRQSVPFLFREGRTVTAYQEIPVENQRGGSLPQSDVDEEQFYFFIFDEQGQLTDAVEVPQNSGEPLFFIEGEFVDELLSLKQGEETEAVFARFGTRRPIQHLQTKDGRWHVIYNYACVADGRREVYCRVWVGGGTGRVEYVAGGMLGRKWTGGQSDAKDVEAILQEAIRECERKSGGQWKEALDTVRLRLVLSRYRSESGKVSADDERGLCQQVERILVKESKDAASDAASGFGSDLVAARLRERLTRFRCEESQTLYSLFPGDTVDLSPLLWEHRRAAEALVKLSYQAYQAGTIDEREFIDALLLLNPPSPRIVPETEDTL